MFNLHLQILNYFFIFANSNRKSVNIKNKNQKLTRSILKMQSSSAEQIAYKQNFVDQRLNYVSCIRITKIANRREAINELHIELESSQFKYGPLVSFRVIDTPIRDAPNDPMYHQTVIAFAQFKYTISNYLAIKDYHNILFHGYRLQFQMAGETNWQ